MNRWFFFGSKVPVAFVRALGHDDECRASASRMHPSRAQASDEIRLKHRQQQHVVRQRQRVTSSLLYSNCSPKIKTHQTQPRAPAGPVQAPGEIEAQQMVQHERDPYLMVETLLVARVVS